MSTVGDELQRILEGDVTTNRNARVAVQRDASLFSLTPQMVVYPKSVNDIQKLIPFALQHKLSITPRGAGTDMTGAAIGTSIILDTARYLHRIATVTPTAVTAQSGALLRTIDPTLASMGVQLASAPVSRTTSTIGGMVANNAGGEYSLQYGNTAKAVRTLKVVLADGNEYTIAPLSRKQLDKKMAEPTFEGTLYKNVFELIDTHYDTIRNARPAVPRISSGYALWDVWDKETGVFDLTQLFAGSQGTLGIITEATLEPVAKPTHSATVLAYMSGLRSLDAVITTVLGHTPATFEGYDEPSLRHFKTLYRQLGLHQLLKGITGKGMFFGIELQADTEAQLREKVHALRAELIQLGVTVDIEPITTKSTAFWRSRRSVLALLQTQSRTFHGTPLIDDFAVPPTKIGPIIPKVRALLKKYALPASIHGHLGDGALHIIPIGPVLSQKHRRKLEPLMRELVALIKEQGGALSSEHNDGMARGPWLKAAYGPEVYDLFVQTKELFDPHYLFNPHKKTDASWAYSMHHTALPATLDNV